MLSPLKPVRGAAQPKLNVRKTLDTSVDNRSMRGRRYYDIQTAITNDQGGAEHLPEVKLQLIRRFSGTSVIAEEMEAQYVRGEVMGPPNDRAPYRSAPSAQ